MNNLIFYVVQILLLDNIDNWRNSIYSNEYEFSIYKDDFINLTNKYLLLTNELLNNELIKLQKSTHIHTNVCVHNKKITFIFHKSDIIKDLHLNKFLDIKKILIYQNNLIINLMELTNQLSNDIHDLKYPANNYY